MDVRLVRKNQRWSLCERTMFSHAGVVDVTMLAPSGINPQDLHQQCSQDFQGKSFLTIDGIKLELKL